jgi:hypothetical protein
VSNTLERLVDSLNEYFRHHPDAGKEQLKQYASSALGLTPARSLLYNEEVAIRFAKSNSENQLSNTILSLSALRSFDNRPVVLCIARPGWLEFLLMNSTFIKKVSHSSKHLAPDNIKGSINGTDIMRSYNGTPNEPAFFDKLFQIHAAVGWEDNLNRIVKATGSITPVIQRFEPDEAQRLLLLESAKRATEFEASPERDRIEAELRARVLRAKNKIVDEVNRGLSAKERGDKIEEIINDQETRHGLADCIVPLDAGAVLLVDIKTKVMGLNSAPKAYNIDKLLRNLADGHKLFALLFVGIDATSGEVAVRLMSFLDDFLIPRTVVQDHWAGRDSRGVAQFSGALSGLFAPGFERCVDPNRAREFIERLIGLGHS